MPDEPRDLLRAAIDRSGLGKGAFARQLMVRNPATIRRWLSGEIPIPQVAIERLHTLILSIKDPDR